MATPFAVAFLALLLGWWADVWLNCVGSLIGHKFWDSEALEIGLSHLRCTQGHCPIWLACKFQLNLGCEGDISFGGNAEAIKDA